MKMHTHKKLMQMIIKTKMNLNKINIISMETIQLLKSKIKSKMSHRDYLWKQCNNNHKNHQIC